MTDPDSMEDFLLHMLSAISDQGSANVEKARAFLSQTASFMYCAKDGVNAGHISAFHKWWEDHHEEVLGLRIDDVKCVQVARVLADVFAEGSFPSRRPPAGLTPELIANVRFFTASQDFGGRFRQDPFELAATSPQLFDPRYILSTFPQATDELLNFVGAEAQFDKRHDFSRRGAEWLLEACSGEAITLYDFHEGSIRAICAALTNKEKRLGFSSKKANMFVRDMFDWGVWEPGSDVQSLDVAADANTIRIALRTGILRTELPALLPSYMDVYCYQYMSVDKWVLKAWRRVWELWDEVDSSTKPAAPAFFDYLIYRLGQTTCRKTQRRCEMSNKCSKLKTHDCPLQGASCDGHCPLKGVCEDSTRSLQPPKSISRLGRTGWEAGRTDMGGGLGISS